MKKKIISLLMCFILLLSFSVSVFAENVDLPTQSIWGKTVDNLVYNTLDYVTGGLALDVVSAFQKLTGTPTKDYNELVTGLKTTYGTTTFNGKGVIAPSIKYVSTASNGYGCDPAFTFQRQGSVSAFQVGGERDRKAGCIVTYDVVVPVTGYYDCSLLFSFFDVNETSINKSTAYVGGSFYNASNVVCSSFEETCFPDDRVVFSKNVKLNAGTYKFLISCISYDMNAGHLWRGYIQNPVISWSDTPLNSGLFPENPDPFKGGGGQVRGYGAGRIKNDAPKLYDPAKKMVTNFDIFDESNNTLTLSDGTAYIMPSWNYDFSNRTYSGNTTDNSKHLSVEYGDKNVVVTVTDNSTGAVTINNYYYVSDSNSGGGSSSSSSSSSGSSSSSSSSSGSGDSSSSSSSGGSGGSSSSSSSSGSGGGTTPDKPTDDKGIWNWLFGKIGDLISTIFKGILDILTKCVGTLVDGVIAIIENLFKLLNSVVNFGGDFPKMLQGFFFFLPPEIITLICLMFTLSIAIIIIKFFIR